MGRKEGEWKLASMYGIAPALVSADLCGDVWKETKTLAMSSFHKSHVQVYKYCCTAQFYQRYMNGTSSGLAWCYRCTAKIFSS